MEIDNTENVSEKRQGDLGIGGIEGKAKAKAKSRKKSKTDATSDV